MKKVTMALSFMFPMFAVAESHIIGSIPTNSVSATAYPSLAKLSLAEATNKALSRVAGKVTEAALEREDGYLVYSVEIITSRNKRQEVTIDAGDGRVLSVEDE